MLPYFRPPNEDLNRFDFGLLSPLVSVFCLELVAGVLELEISSVEMLSPIGRLFVCEDKPGNLGLRMRFWLAESEPIWLEFWLKTEPRALKID